MIEVKDLQAGYGKIARLHGISCAFRDGELTAVIGMNGCGKSTLLKAMTGLLKPLCGEVALEGRAICDYPDKERARILSYLPQSRGIPAISVERMVLHGRFPYLDYPRRYRKEDYEHARGAMERAGILSLGEKRMDRLSGGERQKAYLAMAIAQDTKNILLDEPTTFLDITHQLEIMSLLAQMKQEGRAVVAVLHDISGALRYADRLLVMEQGRAVMLAKPDEIYESGVLEQVFRVKARAFTGEEGKRRYYFY